MAIKCLRKSSGRCKNCQQSKSGIVHTKCCRFIRIPACISEHISCCDFRSLALQLKDNCKKNTSFMILCCNTNLSYLVPLVHGLQSCCCQNKFDFFVFFTCKGSKIWRACKNNLNHHLDHHPHGWQHFWGFFLASETFCGFQKLHCDDDGVGVSNNAIRGAATKRKRLRWWHHWLFQCNHFLSRTTILEVPKMKLWRFNGGDLCISD